VVEPVESAARVRSIVREARERGKRIGLVPTMGALHEGHVALIRQCRALTDFVAVSIFVNPTQFGTGEDFGRYPRPLDHDLRACESAGVDLIFTPNVQTVYPHGPSSSFVEVPGLSDILEGAKRPGHFRGVATVVLKLFELVRPDLAIFGQKDYQQQLVIRRMVEDLHVPVELTVAPTIREADGLALSSRNRYLNPQEREAAPVVYRALERAMQAVGAGERMVKRVRQILQETLELEPLVTLDYAEIVNAETLEPLGALSEEHRAVALLAVRIGTTRLIDNVHLSVGSTPLSVVRESKADHT
jgi:pantoate--beta-alanine ligase